MNILIDVLKRIVGLPSLIFLLPEEKKIQKSNGLNDLHEKLINLNRTFKLFNEELDRQNKWLENTEKNLKEIVNKFKDIKRMH